MPVPGPGGRNVFLAGCRECPSKRHAAEDRILMYPFWDIAVWPLIQAARARRIVEIGALRGETTVLMLETLGDDTELHVIDPVPEFDPTEHEKRFPGRYIFH